MIRPFAILCFFAAAGTGAWLYQVKHQVATQDRELRDIWRQIEVARDRTSILRAEWAMLNEPERLRQVAMRHLPLEPMQPQQFTRLPEMERRLPVAVAFAGPPNLFLPPEPTRGTNPNVMLAAAQTPAPAARPAAAQPRPAVATAPDPRAPESPAPQALAAAVAAQRAAVTRLAPPVPPRPAPLRDATPTRPPAAAEAPASGFAAAPPRAVQPAIHMAPPPPATPPIRMTRAEPPAPAPAPATPTYVSALGGASALGLGRPMLAPPVPISSAAAATLDRGR